MSGAFIAALAALRRMLSPAALLLAAAAGALAGAAVLGLPDSGLAADIFPALLQVLAALLLLPLAAALPSGERAGGFEQLVAVRPIGSVPWALGRLAGGLVGAATLALLLAATARAVGSRLPVPVESMGLLAEQGALSTTWRFPLPAGVRGPFDLRLATLPVDPAGAQLHVTVMRGDQREELAPVTVQRRSVVVAVPDLWPERGDLQLVLRGAEGLLPGHEVPRLVVGSQPLGRAGLPLPDAAAGTLLLATLAALAAGCAFHFETACLAGLLAVAVRMPAERWIFGAVLAGLVLFAILGTALQRRAALP